MGVVHQNAPAFAPAARSAIGIAVNSRMKESETSAIASSAAAIAASRVFSTRISAAKLLLVLRAPLRERLHDLVVELLLEDAGLDQLAGDAFARLLQLGAPRVRELRDLDLRLAEPVEDPLVDAADVLPRVALEVRPEAE